MGGEGETGKDELPFHPNAARPSALVDVPSEQRAGNVS